MCFSFGDRFRITLFGQSHAEAIGVVIDGLPAGIEIDFAKLERFMTRRAPRAAGFSTARREPDKVEFVSGLVAGKTCGAPLCGVIFNRDARSADYKYIPVNPRPGHSDYAAFRKYGGESDFRGGGAFSGRMTAPYCIAGAIAKQILGEMGICVGAHICELAGVRDAGFDSVLVDGKALEIIGNKDFPTILDKAGREMQKQIEAAAADADSVGGIVECAVTGLEAGAVGGPLFGGIEGKISSAVFAIPAVKGIEFGSGFSAALLRGSVNNDEFTISGGEVSTATNRAGGILGGISNGMPVVFRAAFKPTPSIGKKQRTVDLVGLQPAEITVAGRHDPCVVPRAVPAVEAAAAVAVLDMLMSEGRGV